MTPLKYVIEESSQSLCQGEDKQVAEHIAIDVCVVMYMFTHYGTYLQPHK